MPRIFAYIGSPHGRHSNTYTLAAMFLEALVRRNRDIQYQIFTPADSTIAYCTGCWSCMAKGFCPQDATDDMGRIKEAMKQADLIVLGSPVYVMNVSGQMKTFIDRLPAWFHAFPLAGKAGVTVVTTGGGGMEEVQNYLRMLMVPLGLKHLGHLGACGNLPGVLYDMPKVRSDAENLAADVYPYLVHEKEISSDETFEMAFSMMKGVFTNPEITFMQADSARWRESGLADCDSYEEYLKRRS